MSVAIALHLHALQVSHFVRFSSAEYWIQVQVCAGSWSHPLGYHLPEGSVATILHLYLGLVMPVDFYTQGVLA